MHGTMNVKHVYYTSRVIKSRGMRWVGNVAVWETGEEYTGFWWGYQREGDHLQDMDLDGRIILK